VTHGPHAANKYISVTQTGIERLWQKMAQKFNNFLFLSFQIWPTDQYEYGLATPGLKGHFSVKKDDGKIC
jgi:hypothetical protein